MISAEFSFLSSPGPIARLPYLGSIPKLEGLGLLMWYLPVQIYDSKVGPQFPFMCTATESPDGGGVQQQVMI